jgi:hypothetical protein
MLEFIRKAFRRRRPKDVELLQALVQATGVGLARMQMMQMVAQRVVDSLARSVRVPGPAKKALAMEMVREDLDKLGIVATDSLISAAIEASVKLRKALDREPLPFGPGQTTTRVSAARGPERGDVSMDFVTSSALKVDATGRPPNGNSGKGLSL